MGGVAPKRSGAPPKRKTVSISAPKSLSDPVDLADWLELNALVAKDRNSSKGDLQALLMRAGSFDPATEKDKVEALCLAAFAELESRVRAANGSYPFTVSPPLITAKASALTKFPAYVFCLCLSAWRWIRPTERPAKARQLFEDLSCFAARNFLNGESLRFASPRKPEIRSFVAAIDKVCELVGEGNGFRRDKHSSSSKKDDTLDVVAWKRFPDKRAGSLIMFGQCASGNDWIGKRSEMQPRAFISSWIDRDFAVDCVRAFFVPHRIAMDEWEETSRKGGIAFDRCRVSFWSHGRGQLPETKQLVDWCRTVLPLR